MGKEAAGTGSSAIDTRTSSTVSLIPSSKEVLELLNPRTGASDDAVSTVPHPVKIEQHLFSLYLSPGTN